MANILLTLFVSLLLAYVISEIFRFFDLPRVIGQILAGIVLGAPVIKDLFFTSETLSVFSVITNIGVILLFFFIGLEIDLKKFKKNVKESSYIAIFNTIIPLASGFLVGRFIFGFNTITSLILGIAVSVSSQAMSLDILEETKLLKTKVGNLILTSGTVDDVFELFLVSILLIVFHAQASETASFQVLVIDILIFVCLIFIARYALIPWVLRIFEREKSKSNLFMGSLLIVLLMAYLSELLSVGSLIGALVAGVLVRQTLLTGEERKPWKKNEISHAIHMLSFGFLIPLFFVYVGLNTHVESISTNALLVVVFALIDIFGTLAGTIIGVLLSKGTFVEGMLVGFGVLPKGDTELVIATLALNNNLITREIFTVIISVALISTFVAPIVFKMLLKRYAKTSNKNI